MSKIIIKKENHNNCLPILKAGDVITTKDDLTILVTNQWDKSVLGYVLQGNNESCLGFMDEWNVDEDEIELFKGTITITQ